MNRTQAALRWRRRNKLASDTAQPLRILSSRSPADDCSPFCVLHDVSPLQKDFRYSIRMANIDRAVAALTRLRSRTCRSPASGSWRGPAASAVVAVAATNATSAAAISSGPLSPIVGIPIPVVTAIAGTAFAVTVPAIAVPAIAIAIAIAVAVAVAIILGPSSHRDCCQRPNAASHQLQESAL